MAYILGFTFADGNVYQNTLSWKLANNKANKDLLRKINKTIGSTYPIEKQNDSFRLRINHPLLVKDLINLGVIPNKSKRANFPKIPPLLLRDFIRGFLDGDGWIIANRKKMEISIGFSDGGKEFLKGLVNCFNEKFFLSTSNLRRKLKLAKNKKISSSYAIEYYSGNAYKIIRYLYDGLKKNDLFLATKYQKQLRAREIYEDLSRGTKLRREIEDRYKLPMKELLLDLYKKQNLNGVQIAEKLKVHSSSIYRWLAKTEIRSPVSKQKRIVITKCLICEKEIIRYRGRQAKYCSFKCRLKARQTGKFVKCVWCGKKIYRSKWWFKANTTPFCSRKCRGRWQGLRLGNNLLIRSKSTGRFLNAKPFNELCRISVRK